MTTRAGDDSSYLVVGNGSARRTEKAPGHLDERAEAFDAGLGRCLKDGLWESVRAIDLDLARDLWASVGRDRRGRVAARTSGARRSTTTTTRSAFSTG